MQRLIDAKEVWMHKMAFLDVRKSNKAFMENIGFFRAVLHDTEKLVLILVLGDKIATKIHRAVAGHHNFLTQSDLWEAACDWECARITKPAKPLNGRQTWVKYYSHLPMEEIFNKAGL